MKAFCVCISILVLSKAAWDVQSISESPPPGASIGGYSPSRDDRGEQLPYMQQQTPSMQQEQYQPPGPQYGPPFYGGQPLNNQQTGMYPPQQFQQAYPQQQQQYSQQYSQQGQNDSAASEPTMDYYEWQRQQQEAEEKARAEAKKQEAIRWMAARFPSVDEKLREKFLVARKYEAVEASQMLEASLRWRRAYGCPVDPVPIAHQLALGTIFMAGRDYDGHPIVYHIGGGLPGTATEAQVALAARAAVFWMERATRYSPDGKVTVVVIRDAAFPGKPQPRGLGSLRYPRHLAKILEANFPESLAKAVIYPGDGWFSTIWRVASRFVDAETRNKIHLVGNKRDLLKYVPHDQLLAFLGGANFYRFDVNSIIPNFPQTRYLPGPPGSQPPPQQTPSPPRLPQQPAPWGGGPHQQQSGPSWGGGPHQQQPAPWGGGPHQQQPGPSWGGGPHQQQPGPWGSPPPPPPPLPPQQQQEEEQQYGQSGSPFVPQEKQEEEKEEDQSDVSQDPSDNNEFQSPSRFEEGPPDVPPTWAGKDAARPPPQHTNWGPEPQHRDHEQENKQAPPPSSSFQQNFPPQHTFPPYPPPYAMGGPPGQYPPPPPRR